MLKLLEKIIFFSFYIIVVNIAISNTYYQPHEISKDIEEVPQYKEYNRDRNPLRLRPRMWSCEKGKCVRKIINIGDKPLNSTEIESDKSYKTSYTFLDGCKSVCGKFGSLWPQPTKDVNIGPKLAVFHIDDLAVKFDTSRLVSIEEDVIEHLELILSDAWITFTEYLRQMLDNLKKKGPSNPMPPRKKLNKKFEEGIKHYQYIQEDDSVYHSKRHQVLVTIIVEKDPTLDMNLSTKRESYSLEVSRVVNTMEPRDNVQITISSYTYFGARHGLETLSQLITFDSENTLEEDLHIPSEVFIKDEPIYPYRGLLLDTSRNYYSIDSIKRLIDAMSYNKMNVFHWHLTDTQSFPFVSKRVPEMADHGAYSSSEVYYPDEIQDLVVYARIRGVFVLPELDAPAHAGYGWDWGPSKGLGNLTTCMSNKGVWTDFDQSSYKNISLSAEPPSGQLNPLNENVYKILGNLYSDMVEAFYPATAILRSEASREKNNFQKNRNPLGPRLPMFHMGGDEVNFDCWAKDENIINWLNKNGYSTKPSVSQEGFVRLWAEFQGKALDTLKEVNGALKSFKDGVLIWTSELTKPFNIEKFLDPENYIIQVWTKGWDLSIANLLEMNYRLVMSNSDAWYLDCGYGSWLYDGQGNENNWCSPMKGWITMYQNSPRKIVENFGLKWSKYKNQVLGGETAMWSEQVDEYAVEAKVWPRACAVAERLWSDPIDTTWKDAEHRILEQRRRMAIFRNIHADAIQPEFCRQNDGFCYPLTNKISNPLNFGGNPDLADTGHDQSMQLKNQETKDSEDQGFNKMHVQRVRDINDVIKWTVFVIVLLIMVMVKRRLVCSAVLKLVEYCRRVIDAAGPNGPSMRLLSIR